MTQQPSSAIRIEVLRAADAPAYKALRDASLLRSPEAFSTDYATAVVRPAMIYAARFSEPGSGPFHLGAFAANHRLVGSLGFEREQALFKRHIGQIHAVMIDVNFERQGIARQLLEACIAHAQRMAGLEMLQLSVTASNERAIGLYRRAGFLIYGREPRAIKAGGAGHDRLLMVCPLPGCPDLNLSAT